MDKDRIAGSAKEAKGAIERQKIAADPAQNSQNQEADAPRAAEQIDHACHRKLSPCGGPVVIRMQLDDGADCLLDMLRQGGIWRAQLTGLA